MKLVIVDDEKGIIDGLITIVGRYLPSCEVVGTAHNGIEGFKLVRELAPDIVITDIRMPQADGLEMIRRLVAAGCKARFIILSGYAEFEYARQGIELGVKFYINKPVEEEELEECVNKVIAELDRERNQNSRWHEFVWKDILVAGYDPAVHEGQLLNLPSASGPDRKLAGACALLEFDGEPGSLDDDRILDLMKESLRHYSQIQAFRYEGARFALLVMNGNGLDGASLARDLKKLQERFGQVLGIPVSMGIGQPRPAPSGISASFEEAQQALRYKVIKGAHSIISYKETEQLSGSGTLVPEEEMARLEKCIEELDTEGAADTIRRIFGAIGAESGLHLADLRHQVLVILLSSMRRLSFTQVQLNDFIEHYILSQEEISRFKTLEELMQWLIQAVGRLIEQKQARSTSRKKDVISEIKEYVSVHYASNITLADLSARFFINPYYLSQLFKEKTGDTYLSYVMGVRIQKAKELLEESHLKVYEICQMVGYTDTNHFSKLFEKMTGCTPSEYRKQSPKS